jgi:DegT/DnrJ/EryC1/StrS aminotransferase family
VFSFFGNKLITTGEEGAVDTDDDDLAQRLHLLRGQGMDPGRRHWFLETGFDYRMTNVEAAIGVAQPERLEEMLERRRQIGGFKVLGRKKRTRPLSHLGRLRPAAPQPRSQPHECAAGDPFRTL